MNICILTLAHLSTSPRMLKAADALAAAGHRVRLVSLRYLDWATATDVGSFAAAPMTSDSCWPSLLMRPRVTSGGPVLAGVGLAGGVGDVEVVFSI